MCEAKKRENEKEKGWKNRKRKKENDEKEKSIVIGEIWRSGKRMSICRGSDQLRIPPSCFVRRITLIVALEVSTFWRVVRSFEFFPCEFQPSNLNVKQLLTAQRTEQGRVTGGLKRMLPRVHIHLLYC